MKRPFATIGISAFVTAVILCNIDSLTVSVFIMAALAVFLLFVFLMKPKSKYNIFVLISFAVAVISVSILFTVKNYQTLSLYDQKEVTFSGTVTSSDYYGEYEKSEVKIDCVNGKSENFYAIVYSDLEGTFSAGDKITAKATLKLTGNGTRDIRFILADNRFFTAYKFADISKTGENKYYKAVSKIKESYKNTVMSVLHGDIGAVAIGMTLGDRTGMSMYLKNCFNYSGTAHLLVVSGLHLTIWVMIISNAISFLRKNRLLNFFISLVFIFVYLALTGFSVSVVRAGIMLFVFKLSKTLNKCSDSLNSVGLAVFVILAFNPFSVYSVSFLLSVGSTLGIIMFTDKIHEAVYNAKSLQKLKKYFIFRAIADSVAVCISATVFSLPIFILFYDMFPIFSVVSNILIVDFATALMILTVSGVAFEKLGLTALSKLFLRATGLVSEIIIYIAEKIGMQRYSTVAVSSRFFKYFLVVSVAVIIVFSIVRKHRTVKKSFVVALITALFAFTVFVSSCFDALHPSIDISINGNCPQVLMRDGYDSAFVCAKSGSSVYSVGSMLGRHNLKNIGCIYVTGDDGTGASNIKNVADTYSVSTFAFREKGKNGFKSGDVKENVGSLTLDDSLTIIPISDRTSIIKAFGKDIFISGDISAQNLFEIDNKYDIIILSKDAFELYGEKAEKYLKNSSSEVLMLSDTQIVIYPDTGKIFYSENF